jgi:D-proline reductase (dithiol) PrdB
MCHRSVGLVQSAIEAAGMSTVSVSMRPEISLAMKMPRAAYLRFPLGNPFGEPGRADQQARILEDLFQLLETAAEAQVVELPYRWRRWL